MSREKSQFLSGFGTAFQVFKAVADAVLAAGGSDEDLRRVLSEEGLAGKIAKIIVGETSCFQVTVDYGQTLGQMVRAGNYDWVNSDITAEHFPIQGNGQQEVEVVLFHFNKTMTSDQVISEMQKAGFRPARIEELLALGASQPELQKQFPIVALGSVWRLPDGSRRVPCLRWDGARRRLGLDWLVYDWSECSRFAAVCNAS